MSDTNTARTEAWTPPPRPDWVAKIIEEGKCMDIKGVVPLDENSLLDKARRNTGLSDFGDDDWHEPFQRFIKSLDDDAQLHLMGRLMTRSDILMLLEARLRIEDTYKKHPEIDDEQIKKPLLVMGQGRTGTSVLQNMLSADPNNGPLMTWESMFPCPPLLGNIEGNFASIAQQSRIGPKLEWQCHLTFCENRNDTAPLIRTTKVRHAKTP